MTRTRFLIVATILTCYLWHFGSVLLLGRSFGFRDAANYYYPLFEWECNEWAAGRVPLWNPLDNLGTPVLADTTSSVLYPGKLVFVLPVSFRLRYHIYITAHVLLAAVMAYRLARHWAASREAAGLAALSYAFGGSVLFQYCNVVFLVGAAWLPFGLLAADRMLREHSFRWAMALGATLALMVLGGDPQSAYHTGMLAALYACVLWYVKDSQATDDRVRWHQWRFALLAFAAISGLALSLVQVLPAAEWARQSSRRTFDSPRNVYEISKTIERVESSDELFEDIAAGMFATPKAGTHHRHVYDFSNGPWHLLEFVWPNFFGRNFPINSRWSNAFPGEGRTWTPSLYVGLLPFVLALLTWRLRRCDSQLRFISLLTLLAIIASFGWYGVGWLVHEVRAAFINHAADESQLGEPVGGLYWLFVTVLPGYVYFRYPAKLMVIASLGVSLLAARGWDDFVTAQSRRLAAAFVGVATVSMFAAIGFGLCQQPWSTFLADATPDTIFGPLVTRSATISVLAGLLQATLLGLAYWFVLRATNKQITASRGVVLLAITAIELCIANGWMTLSIPGATLAEPQVIANAIHDKSGSSPPPRLYRDTAAPLIPKEWSKQSNTKRLAEVVAWERATLLPKHHLSANVAIIGSHTTMTSADWQAFMRMSRSWEADHTSSQRGQRLSILSLQAIVADQPIDASTHKDVTRVRSGSMELLDSSKIAPRAWIVHEVTVIPPLAKRSVQAIDLRTRDVLCDGQQPRDLYKTAVIESHVSQLLVGDSNHSASEPDEACRIVSYAPQRIEIEAKLISPGGIILNDAYYSAWQATLVTDGTKQPLAIYQANRVMRAIMLPAGHHHIVFEYSPSMLYVGGIVSITWWLVLVGFVMVGWWSKLGSRVL